MEDNWETVALGEVATVRSGYAFKSSDWTDSGIPVVKIANVKGGRLEMTGCSYVTPSVASEAGEFQLKQGDILVAMTGYIGDVARVRKSDLPCVLNQRVGKFSVRDDRQLDANYLFSFLSWSETRQAIEALGYGSAQPNVSPSLIHKVEMPLPPLSEQKAIAAVLGALDDKIELNRRMNATLEAMARALFQSWFVDFDPVRAKLDGRKPDGMDTATAALFPSAFQDSELGPIPKGWTVMRLSELCTVGRGASPRPINDYMNGEVPWVKIADATAAGCPFLFETKEKVKKAGAEKSVAVAPGDLILSNSATCGVPIFVELNGCIHDGWLYFKDLRSISKLYLFHVLIELAEHLVHIADGSVQKNLNTNLVGQQNVLVPPKALVDAFDAQATVWFAKMRQNGLESRTLATLRDTLLPKLLSGELSVSAEHEIN